MFTPAFHLSTGRPEGSNAAAPLWQFPHFKAQASAAKDVLQVAGQPLLELKVLCSLHAQRLLLCTQLKVCESSGEVNP